MSREDQIIGERLRKIDELRKQGINPYPHKFDRKNSSSQILKSKLGTKVVVAGRIMTKRDIGKIIFANLRDHTGDVQIVLQEGETQEKVKDLFKKYVDVGDFVGIEGKVFKTKTKQISILVDKLTILSKSILPLPEKFHGLQDKEERYRKRYLDLIMNPEVRQVFEKRTKILKAIREFMDSKGFEEVDTPYLQGVYGGANARPFKTHLNTLDIDLFLSISPELYLKRLIVGGYDRVYTIARNFRNEGVDRWHNPEFTMMEVYAAYWDYNDMME
ncbi:MAG TPA: amino acid--tRNA ligase-related protein, partial [Candidatus Nanoarchaeia archaeon]|nr:amino acid--tRNA ligase-related protein [Candidatus Nanoarchaeia archaeon]